MDVGEIWKGINTENLFYFPPLVREWNQQWCTFSPLVWTSTTPWYYSWTKPLLHRDTTLEPIVKMYRHKFRSNNQWWPLVTLPTIIITTNSTDMCPHGERITLTSLTTSLWQIKNFHVLRQR
jgi:hypothetical protein